MKKIKTFITVVSTSNDDQANEFLRNHKVKSIKSFVSQGCTFTDGFIDRTIKPLLITRIIYDD